MRFIIINIDTGVDILTIIQLMCPATIIYGPVSSHYIRPGREARSAVGSREVVTLGWTGGVPMHHSNHYRKWNKARRFGQLGRFGLIASIFSYFQPNRCRMVHLLPICLTGSQSVKCRKISYFWFILYCPVYLLIHFFLYSDKYIYPLEISQYFMQILRYFLQILTIICQFFSQKSCILVKQFLYELIVKKNI